jgi:hypothetical protein
MKHPIHHPHSPFRIFAFSALATVAALVGMLLDRGIGGMFIALVLIAVEVAFSFDNAILNAKILANMSRFWQNMFLTIGALIAIFGMRIVFPIVIVALTAGIGLKEVLDLALHNPHEYAKHLEHAHPTLSAFGGAFLLILSLDFLVDDSHEVMWLTRIEQKTRRLHPHLAPPLLSAIIVGLLAVLPFNEHAGQTFIAGIAGIVTYSIIHGLTSLFGRMQERDNDKPLSKGRNAAVYTGVAAFTSFLYLEVLDATFSFDSVLGAFAVTSDVVLIAIGLGVGAMWVRSLTIFMVRRKTLGNYKYIEHGAHYTIFILACILFTSLFIRIPEVITGFAGIGVIISSIIASRQAMTAKTAHA